MTSRTSKNSLVAWILAAVMAAPACASDAPVSEPQRLMEIAICLDTSGSMDGLINSARQKLWAIVNDLATSQPTPRLRLALLTFGNDGHPEENGWVNVDTDFTEDLDMVSQRLFALSTNGGTELVGRVMNTALQSLTWSGGNRDLKLLFVCGNESADQDQVVPFRDMSRKAIAAGIMVNSIYCGPATDELAPAWQEISRLADGHFASIDMNKSTVVIPTPFDEAMNALSGELNSTYIPIGTSGQQAWANQKAQDENALGLNSAAAATRAQTKCATVYVCGWDLVDAMQNKTLDWAEVKTEELPENMRAMTQEERVAHIEAQAQKRAAIQDRITDIGEQRETFLVAERKRQGIDNKDSFDVAVRTVVRAQAETLGFEFAEEAEGVEGAAGDESGAGGAGASEGAEELPGGGAGAGAQAPQQAGAGSAVAPQLVGPPGNLSVRFSNPSQALRDRVSGVLVQQPLAGAPEAALVAIAARLGALPPVQRDAVSAAAGRVASDCPYTGTYLQLVQMLDDAVRGEPGVLTAAVKDGRLRHLLAAQDHLLAELRAMTKVNRQILVDLGVAAAASGEPTAPMTVDAAAATRLHTTMRGMRDTIAALPSATTEGIGKAQAVIRQSLGNFPFKGELISIRERLEALNAESAQIRRLAITSNQEDPQVLAAILDRQRRLDDGAARLQMLLAEFFRNFC